jgi:hypothetical protein
MVGRVTHLVGAIPGRLRSLWDMKPVDDAAIGPGIALLIEKHADLTLSGVGSGSV